MDDIMRNWVAQVQTEQQFHIRELELNERNSAACKLFLEHLRFNPVVQCVTLEYSAYFGSVESCQLLGEVVRRSTTLLSLSVHGNGMDGEGLSYIIRGLLENPNSVLRRLEIGSNAKLGKRGAELVEELLLRDIPSLICLGIWGPGWTAEQTAPVARALAKNRTLRELACGVGYGISHADQEGPLTCFLKALTPVDLLTSEQRSYQDDEYNTTLEILSLNYEYEKGIAENLVQMLTHNTSLKTLGMRFFQFDSAQWSKVWEALRNNHKVEALDLYRCGAGLGDAFAQLMNLLQTNRTIKTIVMAETPLDTSGQSALVKQQLERNARLANYFGILQSKLQFVPPKIGRLFLCGYPRAGKTTLRRSMVGTQGNAINRSMFEATSYMSNQSCFFPSYFDRRTQGIEIRLLRDSTDKHIAVWDMAGQDEFYALHDSHYMFPDINQACVFLFLYKPVFNENGSWEELKSAQCLEKELCYWLGFITSNCRKTGGILPQVSVVLTHLDKLSRAFGKVEANRKARYVEWARTTGKVDELSKVFEGRVDLDARKVHAVNAMSSRHARAVVDDVFERFDYLFSTKLPQVPVACEEMNLFLAKWTAKKSNNFYPIITQEKFFDLCKENEKLNALFRDVPAELASSEEDARAEYLQKNELAVACYLHDVGSIIHFPNSSFVVVDPNWLGKVFLGQLFRPGDHTYKPFIDNTANGRVSPLKLEVVLDDFIKRRSYRGFKVGDLIRLMKELELCYEDELGTNPPTSSYFIPSTLSDPEGLARQGRRRIRWTPVDGKSIPIYSGLRLQCTDQFRTFLSPGFFQRFQVHLQKFLRNQTLQFIYKIEKNLIILQHDGLEILMEKSGDNGLLDGDYVDILVKSYSQARGAKRAPLVVTDLVEQLRLFCASREGCPGVALQEAILRPKCVERPSLCCDRKNQAVLKEYLTKAVVEKLFESDELEVWDDDSYANSIQDVSEIYKHYFPPVPGDEYLAKGQWVEAMEMLSLLDVKEAIFKYRVTVSEQRYGLFQAVDEVQRATAAEMPSTSREIFQAGRSNASESEAPEGPPDGPDAWRWYLNEMDRRVRDPLARQLREVQEAVILKIEEQTKVLLRHIALSLEDMQMLHQKMQSTMMEKMDELMGFIANLEEIPGLPYFSDKNASLSQRLVAFIQIGKPIKLHFMCESPNQPHYIEGQQGLSLVNLMPGDKYKKLRPLVLGSLKILFILVKVGLHVAAGIGSAIPNFLSWPGATPLIATTLTGANVMDNIKGSISDSKQIDSSLAEAWGIIQGVMAPVKAKGQISEVFQLYQVRYKSEMLSRYLSGTKRRCFWVCQKCRDEAARADLLL